MTSLYDVKVSSLRLLIEKMERQAKYYRDTAEQHADSPEDRQRFIVATATLLNEVDDLKAIIDEVEPQEPISRQSRDLVDNLINDALIDLRKNEGGNTDDTVEPRDKDGTS